MQTGETLPQQLVYFIIVTLIHRLVFYLQWNTNLWRYGCLH